MKGNIITKFLLTKIIKKLQMKTELKTSDEKEIISRRESVEKPDIINEDDEEIHQIMLMDKT
jgi:hypothetical protein